jgi:hypothetical protein
MERAIRPGMRLALGLADRRLVEAVHADQCSVKGWIGPDLQLITIPADLITAERRLSPA